MIVALILSVASQCGPGGCPAPSWYTPSYRAVEPLHVFVQQPDPAPSPTPQYGWHGIKHDGLKFQVWGFIAQGGKIEWNPELPENVASYKAAEQAHQKALAEQVKLKPSPTTEQLAINYGVDHSKLNRKEVYTANSPEAQDFVIQAQAASDGRTDRIYLTVIGEPSDRKRISDDWHRGTQFSEWKDRVWFQEFARGDWQVRDDLGYEAKGKPTILVQKPGGFVVMRATQYNGPAPVLAALRKADPNYRPSNDPGPDEADAQENWGDSNRVAIGVMVFLVAILFFIPRRKP